MHASIVGISPGCRGLSRVAYVSSRYMRFTTVLAVQKGTDEAAAGRTAAAHESRSKTAGSAASAALPAAVLHTGMADAQSGPASRRLPLTSSCLSPNGTARLQAGGGEGYMVSQVNLTEKLQLQTGHCNARDRQPKRLTLMHAAGSTGACRARCPPCRLYNWRCPSRTDPQRKAQIKRGPDADVLVSGIKVVPSMISAGIKADCACCTTAGCRRDVNT